MTFRPRILAIAEAANPTFVSVPLVGWSLAHALRDVADVHLVTQVRNRSAILAAGYEEGHDFTAIDTEDLASPMWRLSGVLRGGRSTAWTVKTAIDSLTYPYFERKVRKQFGAAIRAGDYEVVHRITPLTPTAQSSLAKFCASAGVPFIMGPLNGGVPWPPEFAEARRYEREWLSRIRGAYKAMPGRAATLKHATAILTGSRHTQQEVPPDLRSKTIWLPENAVDPARFDLDWDRPEPGPRLRACFVGRMVPYKGPDMLVEAAMPLLKANRMEIDFIGDGPLREGLEQTVAREGVKESVRLHGAVPHEDVGRILAAADILAFPSIREFGGAVVLEAMALGTVPVVVDYAGPGELITPETAIALNLAGRAELIANLRATLGRLSDDRSELTPRSAAGRQVVRAHFTWGAKAKQVLEVYGWALGKRPDKPDFATIVHPDAPARIDPMTSPAGPGKGSAD